MIPEQFFLRAVKNIIAKNIFIHGDPDKQQLIGWMTYREASVSSEGDLSWKQICREFSP
jgi:hypothetical protein